MCFVFFLYIPVCLFFWLTPDRAACRCCLHRHHSVMFFNIAMWTFYISIRRKRELRNPPQALHLQSTLTFTTQHPSDFIASFGQYYLGLVVVGTFLKIRGSRPTSFTLVKDFTVVFPFDSASKCNLYFHVGWVLCFSDCADGIFPKTKREKKRLYLQGLASEKPFFLCTFSHSYTDIFCMRHKSALSLKSTNSELWSWMHISVIHLCNVYYQLCTAFLWKILIKALW